MNPGVAKAKAKATKGKGEGHREIESMRIEPAENGVTVTTHHKPAPSKGKKDFAGYEAPKAHVFDDPGKAVGHVAQKLKGHFSAKK